MPQPLSEDAFLERVARVLEVDRSRLTLATRRDELEAWDSLNHLMLMMELERELGVRFSTEDVSRYRSLGEIYARLDEG